MIMNFKKLPEIIIEDAALSEDTAKFREGELSNSGDT